MKKQIMSKNYRDTNWVGVDAITQRNILMNEGKSWQDIHRIMKLRYTSSFLSWILHLSHWPNFEKLLDDNDFTYYIRGLSYKEGHNIYNSIADRLSKTNDRVYDKSFFDKLPLLLTKENIYYFKVCSVEIEFLFANSKYNWSWKREGSSISEHPSLTDEYVRKYINNKYYNYSDKLVSIWDFNVLLKKCTLDKELTVQQMDGTSQKVHVASYFPVECLHEIIKTPDHKQIYFANGREEEIEKDTPCGDLPDIICLLLKKK